MFKKKNHTIVFGIFIVLGMTLLVGLLGMLWLWNKTQQKVIIINKSNQVIESIIVKYHTHKELKLDKVLPGVSISKNITVNTDGSFDIKFVFADGTIVEKTNLGYITNLDGVDSIFLITEKKELEFDQEYQKH